MLEDVGKDKKMPGKVTILAKNFEKKHSAPKTWLEPEHRLNKDNNTTLFRQITGSTEPSSAHPDPEMALQSVRSAQPMAHQLGGHVTQNIDAQPIPGQMPKTDQNHMGGSHIEQAIQKHIGDQK